MARFPYCYPFSWFILLCGGVSLALIFGNLGYWGLSRSPAEPRKYIAGASAEAGRAALTKYGCGGCHVIQGVPNATGRVGPVLTDIGQQVYLGGVLANTPENMVRWIQNPKEVSPQTVMPDLGVSDEEAQSMSEYLYQLSK